MIRYQRPDEITAPDFLGLSAGMTPTQIRTRIATQGLYGGSEFRDPEALDYWRNLIQRELIQDNGVKSYENIRPVEVQYAQQVGGYQFDPTIDSFLSAIGAKPVPTSAPAAPVSSPIGMVGEGDSGEDRSTAGKNYADMTDEELQQELENLAKQNSLLGNPAVQLAGALTPIPGTGILTGAAGAINTYGLRDAVEEAARRGINVDPKTATGAVQSPFGGLGNKIGGALGIDPASIDAQIGGYKGTVSRQSGSSETDFTPNEGEVTDTQYGQGGYQGLGIGNPGSYGGSNESGGSDIGGGNNNDDGGGIGDIGGPAEESTDPGYGGGPGAAGGGFDAGGSDSNDAGGCIIYTALLEQGLVKKSDLYVAVKYHSQNMTDAAYRGYILWARYWRDAINKYPWFAKFSQKLAKAWSRDMGYRLKLRKKTTVFGRCVGSFFNGLNWLCSKFTK